MKKQGNGLLLNLLLLLLVCALFAATDGSEGLEIKNAVTRVSAPVYHGSGNAVAPLCTLSWNAAALPGILDVLRDSKAAISFAVSGEWARNNPEMLSRIALDGHEIAIMGDDPSFDGKLSEMVADLEAAADSVEKISGLRPKLYYSGERNLSVSSRAAQKCGLRHIQNTVDLLCARGEAEDILHRASESASKGNIILIQPTATLQRAMPELIELFRTKGMDIATVSDIL